MVAARLGRETGLTSALIQAQSERCEHDGGVAKRFSRADFSRSRWRSVLGFKKIGAPSESKFCPAAVSFSLSLARSFFDARVRVCCAPPLAPSRVIQLERLESVYRIERIFGSSRNSLPTAAFSLWRPSKGRLHSPCLSTPISPSYILEPWQPTNTSCLSTSLKPAACTLCTIAAHVLCCPLSTHPLSECATNILHAQFSVSNPMIGIVCFRVSLP